MKLSPFALLIVCFGLFTQAAFGCSCITVESSEKDPRKIRESVRRFYLKEFKGALFTGTVLKIEKVQNKIDDDRYVLESKVTIEVEKHWIGVSNPTIVLYTGVGGGDCGVSFEVGQKYFFNPQYIQGRLSSTICDYSSTDAMRADEKTILKFSEILGEAKTFKKSKP